MTYPDPTVQQRIDEWFVPVKVELPKGGPEVERYHPLWTPTFLFLDADGVEADRTMGYLPPREFLAALGLGYARACLLKQAWENAVSALRRTRDEIGDSPYAPEVQYWLGVARYKAAGRPEPLLEEWNVLLDRWPESRWAASASFIRRR